ncbi:hypothetical protein FG386_003495 [Cryptosporidium ryanae]|uniref:uncharacterized protein n=1 Tax=Cryptosporidium ryanae TaxID=515981 RepID=UPI003519DE2C|nr:hypothetical protein FG386_003495 [Cryptosporidium ryanae]
MFSKRLRLTFLWFFLATAYVLSEKTLSLSESSSESSSLIDEEKSGIHGTVDGSAEESKIDYVDPKSSVSLVDKSKHEDEGSSTEGTVEEPESSIIGSVGGSTSKIDYIDPHESSHEASSLLEDSKLSQDSLSQSDVEQTEASSESSLLGSELEQSASEASGEVTSNLSPKSHEESLMLLDDPNYTVDDALLLLKKQKRIQDAASGKTETPFITPLTAKETGSTPSFGRPLLSRLTKESSPIDYSAPKHSIKEPSITEHLSVKLPASDKTIESFSRRVEKSHEDSDSGDDKLDLDESDYYVDVSPFEFENEPAKEVSMKEFSRKSDKSAQQEEDESETEKTASSTEVKSSEFVLSPLSHRDPSGGSYDVSISEVPAESPLNEKIPDGVELENEVSSGNEGIVSPLIDEIPTNISNQDTENILSSTSSEESGADSNSNDDLPEPEHSLQRKLLENNFEDAEEQSLENSLVNVGADQFDVSSKDSSHSEKSASGSQPDEFAFKEISVPAFEVDTYGENEHKANKLRGILLPVSELFQTSMGCASPCPYKRFIIQTDRVLKNISKFESKAMELYNIIKKAREITIKEVSDIFKFHETAIKRRALLFVQKYLKGIRLLLFKIDSAKKVVLLALKARILLQLLPTKNSSEYDQETLQKFYSNIEFVEKEYGNIRAILNSKTIKYGLMKYLFLNESEYSIEPIKVVLEKELVSFSSKMPTFQKFVSKHRNLAFAVADLMKKAGYPVKKKIFMIDRKGLTKEQQRLYKKKVNEDKKIIKSKLSKKDYKNFRKSQENKWNSFSNIVYKKN